MGDPERWHNPKHQGELADQLAALLATPTAWLGHRPVHAKGDAARWHNPERSNELSDQMAALLPTPVVNDMGRGKTVEEWDLWTDEMKERHGNGNGHGASLSIEAARLLPTPTTVDSHSAGRSQGALLAGDTLDLNLREAVKMLPTSAPTTKPSDDGNVSSGDQPQPPPTNEASDPNSPNG